MRLILTEDSSTTAQLFVDYLGWECKCQPVLASSLDEVLRHIAEENGAVDVVILTLKDKPEKGLRFLKEVAKFARSTGVRCPRFLLLSWSPLADRYPSSLKRCRALGIRYLLRRYPEQIAEELRQLVKEAVNADLPSVGVEYVQGHPHFSLIGPAKVVPWRPGPKLLVLLAYFAMHPHTRAHTTAMISEATGIPKGWVKIYMERLRQSFDKARRRAGINIAGEKAFCTIQELGGYLHYSNVNFVW